MQPRHTVSKTFCYESVPVIVSPNLWRVAEREEGEKRRLKPTLRYLERLELPKCRGAFLAERFGLIFDFFTSYQLQIIQ
ncbi:hypothetical protein [Burkholderia sp. MSHR3999]|uniref:hypothetical protein n=1 Tax=Burkholderia sp. MSHR3999 TaxID=1542965 RepID=UPI0012E056CB|nr:hypothetical protein [Burkholderia sp. MSHR3999]